MNVFSIIKLLPVIIDLIKIVEDIIPGRSKGEEKLTALRQILEAVYGPINDASGTIGKIVSIIVGIFNKQGTFKQPEVLQVEKNMQASIFPDDRFK